MSWGNSWGRKANKYRAIKTTVDGITFASHKEAMRYQELMLLLHSNNIQNLRLQVNYPIVINGVKVCSYVADFVYISNGKEVVEDTKGVRTPYYKLKKKLMKAIYGIEIFES